MREDAASERLYRVPASTLPRHTSETLLNRLRVFEVWCAELGVSTRGTRISRYCRYLEQLPGLGPELDQGIFFDPPDSPIRHGLDRYLYVLREAHELAWISQNLRGARVRGLALKLAKIVGGSDFAVLDRNSESRNTQFELRIASYFVRVGFRVDLESLTDVVATKGWIAYHVECKRIASGRQLERRLKEASQQLRSRVPRSTWRHRHVALIAADVTKVAFSHNGLTMGMTPEHSRDVIQEKLVAIGATIDQSKLVDLAPACALWLQIHIPSLVLTPFTPTTRFSSYIMQNARGGRSLRRASNAFWRVFRRIDTSEPDDEAAVPLQPRKGILIPQGVKIAPDMSMLRHLVSTGGLPDLPDEHVVLSVLPPGGGEGDWEDFSFFEFKLIFSALNPEERREFTSSTEGGMRGLLCRLLLLRYPYEGEPDWLDQVR